MAQQPSTNTTQQFKGPGLAAAIAAAVAWFIPGGQAVSVVFFTTFASTYALQAFAMREARKASLQDVSERKSNIRSATSPHRIVYGHALVGGTVANAQVTGSDKEHMHLIVTLAGHEVHSVGDVWFEDVRTTRDGSGNITGGGDLAGLGRILPHLGTNPQTADATFVTESGGKWTTDHKGNGIAYLYVRLTFNQDKLYVLPNIRALVRGRKCYDPRDGGTRLTMNPALCLRDYLIGDFGMDIDPAEIDDTAVAAAANVCDEWVALDAAVTLTPVPDHTTDTWTTTGITDPRIGTGDRCVLSGVPVPSGLTNGATYYVIRLDGSTYQLAATYQDAIEGVPVTFSNNGSGTQTWGTFYQRRYTCNGSFTLDQAPKDIVEDLLSAMAGNLVQIAGSIIIHAGAYTAPTITLTADDLRGPASIRPRKARHDLVNQIRGSYVDASRLWVQSEYPPVGSSTYIAEDDGITIERNVDQPLATDASRAQRIAKIALERSRAGSLSLRCKISALRLRGYDTVAVTIPQLNLSAATYRIMRLDITGDDGGLGVDLALQAESSSTYAWSPSDATAPVPVPVLDIPTFATLVVAPSSLTLASGNAELLTAADGTIISRLRVSWGSAAEPGLTAYEVQYKRSSESVYVSVNAARDQNQTWVAPVEDGTTYDVRVRALAGNRRSAWVTGTHTVAGKTAAPTDPTSLTVTSAVGGFDIAISSSPDADYARTEFYESTVNNRASATLVASISGNRFARSGLGAGVTRYYWGRHVDTSGNVSGYFPASATAGVSATTGAAPGGIVAVATLPASGMAEGDVVYLTTDDKLYRYNGSAWVTWVDGSDILAASVTAGKISVTTLAAISASTGVLEIDATGNIHTAGATGFVSGASGIWMGWDSTAYKFRIGNPSGAIMVWDGANLGIDGAITTLGTTGFTAGTGIFMAPNGGTPQFRVGNPSGAFISWDGSTFTVKGTVMAGDVQVDTTGNIRGGQTGYNTGTGFFLGYSGGAYKFSLGDPAGSYLRWTGSALEVYGSIVDTRPFAAGTTPVAAASTTMNMPGAAGVWARAKAITVPRAGVLRCTWDGYAATTGSNTKTRIYKNGVALSGEFTQTAIGWASHTYDATVAAGDTLELYAWWQIAQGQVRLFTLKNSFNENFFVVVQDTA